MYFVFSAAGTTSTGGEGPIDGTFSSFNYTIYIDPDRNTGLSQPALAALMKPLLPLASLLTTLQS